MSEDTPKAYPAWVKPHDSHVLRLDNGIVIPFFSEHHVQRETGEVTVLVQDADGEAFALAEKPVAAIEPISAELSPEPEHKDA